MTGFARRWLLGARAVVVFLALAAVLGAVGIVAWLWDPPLPQTMAYTGNPGFYYGEYAEGAANPDEPKTLVQQVDPDTGLPVLWAGAAAWPEAGQLCGPAQPQKINFTFTINFTSLDARAQFPLLPGRQDADEFSLADENGLPACSFFMGQQFPRTFEPDFREFVEARGPQRAIVTYGDVRDPEGTVAPQALVSEPVLIVPDPGWETVEKRTTIPAIDYDVTRLALGGATSDVEAWHWAGLAAIAAAVAAGLWVPFAAILPLRASLDAERDARRQFFTGNPDPVITVDRDGTIVEASPAAAQLLRVGTLDGRSVHEFADIAPGRHETLVHGYHDEPSARGMASLDSNVTARLGDGSTLPVDVSLTQIDVDGRRLNVAVIRDATDRVQAAKADAAEARAAHAQQIITATHHELNREIAMMGFALDDLEPELDDPGLMTGLLDAYARLEEGRDNVAALAKLGRHEYVKGDQTVTADDLVVLTNGMRVHPVTVAPLAGVDRLTLRTAVKTIARNAETHGKATDLWVTVTGGSIELRDNGRGADPDALQRSWENGLRPDGTMGDGLRIARRVIEAHRAEGRVKVNRDGGVTVSIEFPTP